MYVTLWITYLFRKVFCNILIQKISKLQSPDRVFSIVHVLILGQLLVWKILYLFVFAACGKHPLSQMFWYKLVFTLTDYILKHKKWCIENDKTPEAVGLLKVIRTPRGLLKVIPIIMCHKLSSRFYCQLGALFVYEKLHSSQHCFHKILHISWSSNSQFFIALWSQQMCEILKATAR